MNRLHIKRYIVRSSMAAAILLSVGGCKDFTKLDPLASLSESTAFTSASTIELVANGMLQAAAVGTYDAGAGPAPGRGYPFGAAAIQQGEMRGEDMVNLQPFYNITYRATYSTTSANNVNHWEQLYALINQANILINGVKTAGEEGIITSDIANSYEAEGRFMRALSHHELLIHFCRPFADNNGASPGVPYRVNPTNSGTAVNEGLALGRGTVAEAYVKLLEDLDFAEAHLPATRENGIARPTAGAAIALKTRIKLHQGDWAGVVAEGAKLGTDAASGTFKSPIGDYELEADPATPFTSYKANKESIFSVANSAASNGGVNGALANMFGPSSRTARDLIATSPNLYNADFWVPGDRRRSDLLIGQTTGNYPFYFTYKYREYGVFGDWAPILRYSEVLLNVAEAQARLGNEAQAFALLNEVRNRSVPESAAFKAVPEDLVLAILNERRVEFHAEGRRWADIHRLVMDTKYTTNGIPQKIEVSQMKNELYDLEKRPMTEGIIDAIPYSDHRFVWPIPSSETAVNPTLAKEQNPNY